MKNSEKKTVIDVSNDEFGTILNCAVRYACGRRSYMPSLVIGFIKPLIPNLSDNALYGIEQDLTDAKYEGGYGDPRIDEPGWLNLLSLVKAERERRGCVPYKTWHTED